MNASIIVCTYNRAESLKQTLNCLAALRVPGGMEWEVIIVDNNSRDQTRQIVDEYIKLIPLLRYEFESQQGLSFARNRGIKCASGDTILFTDDDVCPESQWMEKILAGMAEYGCDACGGYIAPVWEKPPPGWLTERFYGFLAVKIQDNGDYQIHDLEDAPFGANMAFRKEVFEDLGQFDTTLGRKGGVLASGEDWEMFERILAADMKVMYFPDARVRHRVEAFRIRKSYFRRWRFETSLNHAKSCDIAGSRRLMGIPLYVFPQSLRALKNAVIARFALPKDEAFGKEIIVWHFLGMMRGLYLDRNASKDTDTHDKV